MTLSFDGAEDEKTTNKELKEYNSNSTCEDHPRLLNT